jgi:hypothetical protein
MSKTNTAISAFLKHQRRTSDLLALFLRREKAVTLDFMEHANRNDFSQRVAAECPMASGHCEDNLKGHLHTP